MTRGFVVFLRVLYAVCQAIEVSAVGVAHPRTTRERIQVNRELPKHEAFGGTRAIPLSLFAKM